MECFALPRAYFRTDVPWDRPGASTRRVERCAHATAGAGGVDWRPRGAGGEGSAKQRTNAVGGASLSHFEQRPRGTGGAGQIEQRARGSCSSRGARGSCWTERGAGSTGIAGRVGPRTRHPWSRAGPVTNDAIEKSALWKN